MKASIVFFPNEAKKNQKTGKIPVYMRICHRRLKCESRLNAEITSLELIRWDSITMRLSGGNCAINHILERLNQKFQDCLILNSTTMPSITAEWIKDYVLGKINSQQRSVLQFVDDYFQNGIAKNANKSPGTIKTYKRAINHLVKFLGFRKQKTLTFEHLDYIFASDFKNYLVNTNLPLNKFGMTEASAAVIIKKFRSIFSQAVAQELLLKNPFKLVKIRTKSPRKERLTVHQVKFIWKLDLNDFPYQQPYRDIFLFCVFTGLAYNDAMSLTWLNLERRDDGNIKLTINRQKSEVITESFLPSYAIDIAKKYQTTAECEIRHNVLPKRSNKEVNSQLKTIANMTGIPIKLTTHTARHTFRQLLAEAGIADYGVIKRMMGQSRRGDVDEVYYEVTENRLLEAKTKFEYYLNQNL